MRSCILTIWLCLYCSIVMGAQRVVTFRVVEQGTELPLVATVSCLLYDDTSLSVLTGAEGEAQLELPLGQTIGFEVRSMGFNPVQGVVTDSVSVVHVHMVQDMMHLNDVVVTGSRTERPVKLSAVTTQVLGGKALVDAGYADMQHALQQETPGLNIQKVGFGNEISLQGLDARHVLFLQDGERMTGEMAGNLDYERFNLHAIDRIEIVKGASNTLYGSRASGAVINLISKRTTRPLDLQVGLRYGQFNQRNYSDPQPSDFLYMFERNSDRPNLQGWASVGTHHKIVTTQTDVWYSSSDAYYMYQAEHDTKTYTRQANPFLPHDITVTSTSARSPMGIEGNEHVSASHQVYVDPSERLHLQAYGCFFFMNTYDLIQDLAFTQSRDWMTGFKASYDFRDWMTVHLSLHGDFYDRYKRHERIDYRSKVYHSEILEPRLSVTSRFFDGHDIIFGIEHTSDELTSDRFVNRRMTTRALRETEYFLQDEWNIDDRWLLSVGVRTNFSRAFGFMWMPKVAAKAQLTPRLALRANYSMGYRAPSIKELFFNWDHLGMFQIKGNEDLRPEENHYISLGTEWSSDRFFVNVNAYGNFFRYKIEGVWHIYDMQYNFEYVNLNRQRLLGVESILKWRPWDCLVVNGTYSYVNVSRNHGVQVNSTSPNAATASIDYHLDRPRYRLNAMLSASFMGQKQFDIQDRVWVEEDARSYDAYFRCTLPAYALCNFSLGQTFCNRYRVTFGVDNLFDYVPQTLGSGVTMFNVPATCGARFWTQVEFRM